MALDRESIINALRQVNDPELHRDLVTLGRVQDVAIEGGDVKVSVSPGQSPPAMRNALAERIEAAVRGAGAQSVSILWAGAPSASGAGATSRPQRQGALPQVKNVIAVGAGKGGVGKSTIAVNLGVGLARQGASVGVMDGDIYGPSLPTLMGIRGQVPDVRGNRIKPFFVHGVHTITIGALVEQEKPLIWRGPMAHGAFKQLLMDNTEWPELDYLIVDLPPGTGDVPLTLCQLLPLRGAIVVATPQQVALDDAVRAVRMFQQLEAPILGMVENMSYFVAPDGSEHDIFGRGGTERAAARLNLPYLGALPMFIELRANGDAGTPLKNFEGHPLLKESLENLASNVADAVKKKNEEPAGPILSVI